MIVKCETRLRMMKGLKGKLLTVSSFNDTAFPILSYALPFNNFLFFFCRCFAKIQEFVSRKYNSGFYPLGVAFLVLLVYRFPYINNYCFMGLLMRTLQPYSKLQ